MSKTAWTILTGEYPPQVGGVSDYTRIVAENLAAANDDVEVWTPRTTLNIAGGDPRVRVDRLPDHFGRRSIKLLNAKLIGQGSGDRILIQYVPHAFGCKAMNLPFCHWLLQWSRRREIWTLFHEVAFPIAREQSLRHNFLGGVTRLMALMVARASTRIFVTIPAWADLLRPLARTGQIFEWMPVPSSIPAIANAKDVNDVRIQHGMTDSDLVVGHFGTYNSVISAFLEDSLMTILSSGDHHALLLGRGGIEFAAKFTAKYPGLAPRIHASGGLPPELVSAHLSACDILIQPYPDGVSCRRTTTMAGLALGLPIVTNLGPLSESIWARSGAVATAARPDSIAETAHQLLADGTRRADLGVRARRLYLDKFDIRWTIETLRGEPKVSRPGEYLV